MDINIEIPYLSNELILFEKAVNWKHYFGSFFKPYLQKNILEVGAGIGGNIPFLITPSINSYLCIEPDSGQADIIRKKIDDGLLPRICEVENGILSGTSCEQFDAILYIDVIEHIKNDTAELKKAYQALQIGGFLCILVPANPSDYSPFDKALGHYRRYSRKMLISALPAGMKVVKCRYLDSLGAVSSKVNKYFLKQTSPTERQIGFWDKILLPISKLIDPVFNYSMGKSLVLVAQKS